MDCGGWALIYDPGQKRLMLLVELGGSTWGCNVYQTVRSLFVEADHPVPQRLAVHTTSFRRLFPRCSVEDRSDRQKPTCLRRVLRPLGQTANFGARIVCFHYNRSTHDKPPSVCQVESFRERFGNRESLNQRIGINPVFGQGMSVAAQEAVIIDRLLRARAADTDPLVGLAAVFFTEIQGVLETPCGD